MNGRFPATAPAKGTTVISEELPLTPEEIARLIKASGRNQKSVAAELGVRSATVSNWVNGVGSPSHENAAKLRALKPLPRALPDWTAYLADVKARIARNRNPPELPLVAVDPEPIAESVAAKVGTRSQLVDAVKTAIPTATDVANAVKTVIPTATDVAIQVKATVPTAQDIAAEVRATLPIAALVKTLKRGAALVVVVVLLGVSAMVALGYRVAAATERELAQVSYFRSVLGTLLKLGKKTDELWIPKDAFPGQKLAKDCDASLGEEPINGGCWVPVDPRRMAPPCGKLFRHGDTCYRPVSADPAKPVGVVPGAPSNP
jgi:DNA-binding transcriptional regulator YiaG